MNENVMSKTEKFGFMKMINKNDKNNTVYVN